MYFSCSFFDLYSDVNLAAEYYKGTIIIGSMLEKKNNETTWCEDDGDKTCYEWHPYFFIFTMLFIFLPSFSVFACIYGKIYGTFYGVIGGIIGVSCIPLFSILSIFIDFKLDAWYWIIGVCFFLIGLGGQSYFLWYGQSFDITENIGLQEKQNIPKVKFFDH